MRGLWNLFAWRLLERGRLRKVEKWCRWLIEEACSVGLPQGELQWGGVSAARCRDRLASALLAPALFVLHVGSSFQCARRKAEKESATIEKLRVG